MINPYALSFINLILSSLLGLGIIIYKFVYPKKRINLLVLLIIVSFLPIWSIFRPGVYESGDFTLHAIQSMSFYKSLTESILIPRWAGELNGTYGFPAFLFIYSLPYYIIAVFHLIGFSFITSTKLLLTSSFIFSGVFMFLWIKEELNEKAAFIASVFYLYAPYHLVDLHFRADIGELVAFTLLPIVLLLIKRFIEKKSLFFFLLLSLGFGLLIISHPAISIASPPLLIAYIWFCWRRTTKRNYKTLLLNFIPLATGILLSCYSWLPTIFLLRFTYKLNGISFPNFLDFIISPWRYGFLFQGPKGELSYVLGYTQIVILLIVAFMFIKKLINKKDKPMLILFFGLFLGYFFMMQNASQILWKIIPFIGNFQFAYRLLLFTSLFTSVLASLILYKIKNKYIVSLFIILTIGTTVLNWGNRNLISKINDVYLVNMLPSSTVNVGGLAQAAPIWVDIKNPWFEKVPLNHLEIVSGSADIKQVLRTTNYHEYALNVKTDTLFRENTLYFPGWTVYSNDKPSPILVDNKVKKGTIEFILKPGLYDIRLEFKDVFSESFGKIVSFLTALILIILLLKVKLSNVDNRS